METPALRRPIGLWTATGIVVANIIGTGIFTTTGLLIANLESGWLVFLCWTVGGLLALAGAICYSELATMMPASGGEYVFLREIYGPLPAFLSGWISFFVGFSAPIAATGMAISYYLETAGVLTPGTMTGRWLAAAIIIMLTAVHYRGLLWGARIQNALTALKLLLLALLIGGGFLLGKGSVENFTTQSEFWAVGNWSQSAVALLLVMFAYSGWNAASYISGEITDPGRNLPRALFRGTGFVVVLYLLLNGLLFYGAPMSAMRGVEAVGERAAHGLFGPDAAVWLSWLIALALLSSLSAYLMVGPRVYFAMARDGLFFRFAERVHPKWGTPSWSVALQGGVACVMVLTAGFGALLAYIGFALGLTPALVVVGLMILRRREPERARPYRVKWYPTVPLFFLLTWGGILGAALWTSPITSFAAIATVGAGVPAYYFAVAYRRKD